MFKRMEEIEKLNLSVTSFFALISIVSVQAVVSIASGIVAIVTGIMAIRYYYLKSK